MTQLSELATWKADAIAYWEPIIDSTLDDVADQDWSPEYDPEDDKAALKAQLASLMNGFDAPVNAYANDTTRLGPFIDVLFALSSFISNKFLAASPITPVPNLAVMPNNTTKDLFAWWLEELPSFTGLFQVLYDGEPTMPVYDPSAEPPVTSVTGTFSLGTTGAYAAAIEAIGLYAADDLARFQSVIAQVNPTIRARVAYGFFAGSDAILEPEPGTIKDYLLNEFAVSEVLDTFDWEILGLNAP